MESTSDSSGYSDSDSDELDEDWDSESDTAEDILDPNNSKAALFQENDRLPAPLAKKYFEEGGIYGMVLHKKPDNVRLGMVIEIRAEKFIYRTFFIGGSKMKTYHEGAKDSEFEYNVELLWPKIISHERGSI